MHREDLNLKGWLFNTLNPYNAEIFVYKPWRAKVAFQFKIII